MSSLVSEQKPVSETTSPVRLSVIITNYNYEKYVATAIISVRSQSENVEIIVVDDVSTDNSREVISGFGDTVIPVFQSKNQGHGGGFNAGFSRSTGDLVMFLDADDFLLPGAIDRILANYAPDVAIYHYRMRFADSDGNLSGVFPPSSKPLAEGDLSDMLRMTGRYDGTVTSGLVFSRAVLEQVMPMDSEAYRQGGDGYLSSVAPLYGRSMSIDEPLSAYRLHNSQHSKFSKAYTKRAHWCLNHDTERYKSIKEHASKLNLPVADDLGQRDPQNIHERLVSMLFAPSEHPVQGDTIASLTEAGRKLSTGGLNTLWWQVFAIAPLSLKRTLMRWKIDVNARPAVVVWLTRNIRRLIG